jgi:histidyl-tRNA synthetase
LLERHALSTDPLDEVEAALDLLAAYGPPPDGVTWAVDLSLARGLRYYTGLVFEIYVESADGPLQVAGGGRYDDLVRALGGRESVPACGFSYGLERVDLARGDPVPAAAPVRALVVAVEDADYRSALGVAADLRAAGIVVEQDVRRRGPKAALRHADRADLDLVVVVGAEERAANAVTLRDMRARAEQRLPRAALVDAVKNARP